MPQTTPRKKPGLSLADLSPEERDALLVELEEERRSLAEPWAPGAEPRELTAREKAIRLLMRERDHADGCPLIEDEHRAAGRVEAYTEVRPPHPPTGRPAANITVVRCVECGGARYLEDVTVREALLNALGHEAECATDLDGSL